MIERYPLKTIEKKWRSRLDLDTPFSLVENLANSAQIRHFGDIKPLIYADIAQKMGKTPQKIAVSPLFHATYEDKSGNFVSLDDVLDEKQVKKGKAVAFSEAKKNIISNDLVITAYGIDACRLFLVSDNPPHIPLVYDEGAIEGAWRFVNLFWQRSQEILASSSTSQEGASLNGTEIENLFDAQETHKAVAKCREAFKTVQTRDELKKLCTLLFPVIPHVTSEILEQLEHSSFS